jgi:hypothetical protein
MGFSIKFASMQTPLIMPLISISNLTLNIVQVKALFYLNRSFILLFFYKLSDIIAKIIFNTWLICLTLVFFAFSPKKYTGKPCADSFLSESTKLSN